MTARLGLVLLLVIGCGGLARSAPADADDAQARYDRGVAAYTAHDYQAAVASFKAAYALDPRSEILFAWAQAERLSGDCPNAIALYRKFLDGHPTDVQAEAAQVPLEKCERSLASRPEPLPAAAVTAPPATPEPRRRHFYDDIVGDALVGAGLVAAAVGIGLLATAESPGGATSYDEFQARHDSAVTRKRTGGIILGVGGALLGGGVAHWIFWGGNGEAGVTAAGTF